MRKEGRGKLWLVLAAVAVAAVAVVMVGGVIRNAPQPFSSSFIFIE